MKKTTSIAFLATRWGAQLGGINAFNTALCSALTKMPDVDVHCFVEEANKEAYNDTAELGIKLNCTDCRIDDSKDSLRQLNRITAVTEKAFDFWVGHDIWTGPAANALSKSFYRSKSIVIHHMDFAAYAHLKHSDVEAHKRTEYQGEVLRNADFVFGVGPLLTASAIKHTHGRASQISPGLPDIQHSPLIENKLSDAPMDIMLVGRVSREDDAIKQIYMAVNAISKMTHYDGLDRVDWRVKVIGLDKENANNGYTKNIKRLTSLAKSHLNLRLLPFQSKQVNLYGEISRSDLVLMPSLREGFGLVGWEAIAAGVPVIISKKSGLYHHLKDMGLNNMVGTINVRGRATEYNEVDDDDVTELSKQIEKVFKDFNFHKKQALSLKQTLKVVFKASWENEALKFMKTLGLDIINETADNNKKNNYSVRPDFSNLSSLLKSKDWKVKSLREILESWPLDDFDISSRVAKELYQSINKDTSVERLGVIHHTLCWLGHKPDDKEFFKRANRPQLSSAKNLIRMKYVPEGVFVPGSSPFESDRMEDEDFGKETSVSSFYLGISVVTNEQYKMFAHDEKLYLWSDMHDSDKHPVVSINWWQAYVYSIWAGGRLPTEVEWEYACRGGTTTAFYCGNELQNEEFNITYLKSDPRVHINRTIKAISKSTNHPFGLHHMHGNIQEWCWNSYYKDCYPEPHPSRNDYNTIDDYKVAKGGSWGLPQAASRSAFRNRINPNYRNNDLGLRVLFPNQN